MAYEGDTTTGETIDRSDRPGHIGLVLLLAAILVGAILSLRFLGSDQAQPLILGLLAFFAMAGVFFLFAIAIGVIQFGSKAARNDITKLMADTSADGLIVIEDDGRMIYANEAYLDLAGSSGGDIRAVERLFTGAPEVSEAIYRLAQAAREHRMGSEEIRLSPSLDRHAGIRLVSGARAALPRPTAAGGALDHRGRSRMNASARKTSSRNCSTPSTISIMRRPASCRSIPPARSSISTPPLPPGSTTIWPRSGSGGLNLVGRGAARRGGDDDVVLRRSRDVRTETFDLDLRRRNGQFLPVAALSPHRLWPGWPMGASRTLVLNRSPGLDVDEGQRAAEVRFARFFNNTPIAIATVNRPGRILQSNAPFTRLFGTLPRTGEGGKAPHRRGFRDGEGAQVRRP